MIYKHFTDLLSVHHSYTNELNELLPFKSMETDGKGLYLKYSLSCGFL